MSAPAVQTPAVAAPVQMPDSTPIVADEDDNDQRSGQTVPRKLPQAVRSQKRGACQRSRSADRAPRARFSRRRAGLWAAADGAGPGASRAPLEKSVMTYAVLGNLRRKHGGKFLRTGLSVCDQLWLTERLSADQAGAWSASGTAQVAICRAALSGWTYPSACRPSFCTSA